MSSAGAKEAPSTSQPAPSSRPKTFDERQRLRRRKKFRTMEEVYGPNFLRDPHHS